MLSILKDGNLSILFTARIIFGFFNSYLTLSKKNLARIRDFFDKQSTVIKTISESL